MELADYLRPECVSILEGSTKADALRELTGVLSEHGLNLDHEKLLDSVHQREELMSTGIGNGLAIPHVRMPEVKRAAMAVGICPGGVADYESLDGKPVRIIVLIAAPQGQHDTYVRLLAMVTEVLKDPDRRVRLIQAEQGEDAYHALIGKD